MLINILEPTNANFQTSTIIWLHDQDNKTESWSQIEPEFIACHSYQIDPTAFFHTFNGSNVIKFYTLSIIDFDNVSYNGQT